MGAMQGTGRDGQMPMLPTIVAPSIRDALLRTEAETQIQIQQCKVKVNQFKIVAF